MTKKKSDGLKTNKPSRKKAEKLTNKSPQLASAIRKQIVDDRKVSENELANFLKIPAFQLGRIMEGSQRLTAYQAIALADLSQTEPQYWTKLDADGVIAPLQNLIKETQLYQSQTDAEITRVLPHKALRFYFLHIKKCAGTSLIGLAKQQPYVKFYEPNANGNPISDDPNLKGSNRFLPFWDYSKTQQRKFLRRETHNFIANEGHLGENFEKLNDMIYFTVLRDPITRTLSQFHHAKHLKAINSGLNEFVTEKAKKVKWMNNFITYQITGKWVNKYNKDVSDEAIKRLKKFDHVMHQETFSKDIEAFEKYGWDKSSLVSRNVRKKVAKKDTASPETIGILDILNQSDRRVCDHFKNKNQNLNQV